MPRKPREEVAGGVYHVYARGNRREAIFLDDEDRWSYLEMFGSVAVELAWQPLAYCLMTNHVHHLIELTEPNLGAGIKIAHGQYARHFNECHNTGGGHLREALRLLASQERRFAHVLRVLSRPQPGSGRRLYTAQRPSWSSYAATIGRTGEPRWLQGDRLLASFGSVARSEQIVEAVRIWVAAGFEPATSRCEASALH